MKKIIIVDDDSSIKDAVSLVFKQMDCQVTGYPDGNLILSGRFEMPDVFIIDKQLPGVDGLEICKHLKSQAATKDIRVIMMSASPLLVTSQNWQAPMILSRSLIRLSNYVTWL